ncbi:MAG: hypothetical protein KGI69_02465 [Patescibacteria group bacterium]|nr:hypothetical protein [Patescibacteria group bacterium]
MTTTRSARGLTWIDLEAPSEQEIAAVIQRFGINPLVGEELRSSSSLAKVSLFKRHLFVALTVPVRVKAGGAYAIGNREIDFVIGDDFLVTSRADTVEQLENFGKIFEANAILSGGAEGGIEHGGHLFYYLVMKLYVGMVEDLENIKDDLLDAESRIFTGDERRMVAALSKLSRELIDFRQTARVHRDIWTEMLEEDKSLFGSGFKPYIGRLGDEFDRIHELIANCRELLTDLRETNDSLLNTKQNDIIRTLTVINFIFIPATFIAALFTIPASYVPLIGTDAGWTVILLVMVAITVVIWAFIKRKGWL